MQILKTVGLDDRLIAAEELQSVVPVVGALPLASHALEGKHYFLSTSGNYPRTVDGTAVDTEFCVCGKIYKCVEFFYTDPASGDRKVGYRWVVVTFKENGKLKAIQNFSIGKIENGVMQGGGYTFRLNWEEQDDNIDPADATNNAVWAYTVVVRKRGKEMAKTPFDGDVVGFSSKRNQYKGTLSFTDYVPDDNYTYNIFEVTRYGIATGLGDSGGDDLDWIALRDAIRAGNSGLHIGATITVNHRFYGDLELQVVDMKTDDDSLDLDEYVVTNFNPKRRSVTFMSVKTLPRSAYDVPELHESVDGSHQVNPGDQSTVPSEYWCSVHGRSRWEYSNLRLWLNQGAYFPSTDTEWDDLKSYYTRSMNTTTGDYQYAIVEKPTGSYSPVDHELYESIYMLSTDGVYNTNKAYFVKNSDNEMELVPDPPIPEHVNPSLSGYYEADWRFRPNPANEKWDVKPDPFKTVNPDAGYSYSGKKMPGFLSGFSLGFQKALASVKVGTITDRFTAPAVRLQMTSDKIFIPSYRQILGSEPQGLPSLREGELFKFYDKDYEIPEMSLTDRSVLKYDLNNVLTGYYLRTIETAPVAGTTAWDMQSASALWGISNIGFTTKPPLGTLGVPATFKCNMSQGTDPGQSEYRDATGTLTAPGVAWCVVMG